MSVVYECAKSVGVCQKFMSVIVMYEYISTVCVSLVFKGVSKV